MRQSDRSPKWDRVNTYCYKCKTEKPTQSFVIHRIIGDMVCATCQDCRAPRSTVQKIRAIIGKQQHRARQLGIVSTLTLDQWLDKLNRSNGFCHYCGAYIGIELLTVDHVVALEKGGENTADNVLPACWDCNVHKASR